MARATKKKNAQRAAVRRRAKSKTARARKQSARKRPQNKARAVTGRRRRISDPKSRIAHLRVASTSNGHAPLAKGTDIVSLLRRDHQNVRKLLADIESTNSASRQASLLERIEDELNKHTQIEEEIFYPAFHDCARSKEDRQLYYEALEEHHAVDVILPEVKRAEPGSDQFAARAKVLKELVQHHADEEEKEMFPRARKLIGPAALRELGRQVAEKKKGSQSGGILKSILGMR